MQNLPEYYKKFLNVLNKNKVEFIIVGGIAVVFHGYPRFTNDLDILIKDTKENKLRLNKAIYELDPELIPENELDYEICSVIELGEDPETIHVMSNIDGLENNEAFKNLVQTKISNINFKFISLENLLKNKKASGRPQDIADIDTLKKIQTQISGQKQNN